MSLKIDSSKIYIQNAQGQTKFDSSNGLLYKHKYTYGQITFSGSNNWTEFPHNLDYDSATDLIIGNYTVTACAGNLASSLINLKLPASSPSTLHVENIAAVRYYGSLDSRPNILSMVVDDQKVFMSFKKINTYFYYEFPNTPNTRDGFSTVNPDVSVSFKWELTVYKRTY